MVTLTEVSEYDIKQKFKWTDYAKIVWTAFLILIMDLIGFIVIPIALLQTKKTDTTLPKWASLWDNEKDTINGDIYWRQDPKHGCGPDGTSFWCRFKWLAWRNKSFNFGRRVVGFKMSEIDTVYISGNLDIDHHCSTIYALAIAKDGTRYPHFHHSIPVTKNYRIVTKIGWKLWHVKGFIDLPEDRVGFTAYPQLKKVSCE